MKELINPKYLIACLILIVSCSRLTGTHTIILDQTEIEEITAHQDALYVYLDPSMIQDLPIIKKSGEHILMVDNLNFICSRIAQGKKTAPVKTVEYALQEAVACLADKNTTLAAEEIVELAAHLEQYCQRFEAGDFDLLLYQTDPSTSLRVNEGGEKNDQASLILSGVEGCSESLQTRAVDDRTSKTFRNIDVINSINGRYLTIARNAVIVGNLTIGGNTTIDKNLTVLGSQTIAGNLNVTGTINGSSSGSDIVNGGQAGPVTIGTNNATSLTFITNGSPAVTVDASGNTTITGGVKLTGLPSGTSSNILYIDPITGVISEDPGSGVTSVSGGNNINITGTSTAPIVNVAGTTPFAVQVGNSTNGALTSIPVGATDTVLAGNTGANPAFTVSPSVTSLTATTGNITASSGNIVATSGSISAGTSLSAGTTMTAGTGITATTGNIVATAGQVNAGTTITAGTGITATTGNIVASAGNINATSGSISAGTSLSAGTTVTAGTGITATTGNIVATAGQVNAGTTMTAGTGITATTGNIVATAGQVNAGTTVTAGTGLTVTSGTTSITGTANINISGAGITTIGTGGTGAVNIGNATGNTTFTGNAIFADGTAAAPSITFAGSATTGFYQSAADQISLSIAGAEQLTVDSAGGVTIESPTNLAEYTLNLNTNTTGALSVAATGDVVFNLVNILDSPNALVGSTSLNIDKNGGAGNALFVTGGQGAAAVINANQDGQDALIVFGSTSAAAVRIIGANGADALATTNGTVNFGAAVTGPTLTVTSTTTSAAEQIFANDSGTGLAVDASGGTGKGVTVIGNSTATSTVQITGGTGGSALSITATGDALSGKFGLEITTGGQGIKSVPTLNKTNLVAGAVPVLVDSTGAFGIATSSRRFKENFRSLDTHSAKIYDLNPVLFDYKAEYGSGKNQFGLIAEEVEAEIPELVVRNADGEIHTVAYHQLIPLLLNEIKHHKHTLARQSQLIDQLLAAHRLCTHTVY
jgi:hypothetical protein